MEKSYRSLLKAATWRVFGSLTTAVLAYFLTGRLDLSITIGVAEFFGKLVIYFVHERIWNVIPFGKIKAKENDYQI